MDLKPQKPHLFDHTPAELRQQLAEWNLPPFRAEQILQWACHKHVDQWDEMTNIPRRDRQILAERLCFNAAHTVGQQHATDGTQKLLLDWIQSQNPSHALPVLGGPQTQTECVMIPTRQRRTACISSQVGCPVGCRFCASGLGGLDANLTAGQIVEQVWQLARLKNVGRISNVVFMGMGEPLANYNNVLRAIHILTDPAGFNLSARRITLSTVGLPAQIRRLAESQLPITLAISLHAPNDTLRQQLIPWAERVSIQQLIDAGKHYFHKTGREVTLEYILLGQINDQTHHARELARVATQLRSNVNLIRYNEVEGLPYSRPDDSDVRAFQKTLRNRGVNTHIRASRGRDIAAACGQLRHEQSNPT